MPNSLTFKVFMVFIVENSFPISGKLRVQDRAILLQGNSQVIKYEQHSNSKKMKPYLFLILFELIGIVQSTAQTIERGDTIPVRLINLNEITFSANKIAESKRDVAQQVQIIDGVEISNFQAQSTADLLSNTGNVAVQKSQLGGGDINIRGFSANQNVLVIDGVRMNNLIYRAGHLQDIIKTDINSLDRVEILFGPSSTIYGSDALGGVIHLYTKDPMLARNGNDRNLKINAMSRVGSADNERTAHIDLNYGTKKFGILTAFTWSKFGDLMGGKSQNPFYGNSYGERPLFVKRFGNKDSLVKNDNPFLQRASGYTQSDFLQKFLFQQNKYLAHSVNIQYSTSGNVPRYDRLTDLSGGKLKSAEWYYGPQTRFLTAYNMNRNNPAAKFRNIHIGLNYQAIEESRHNRNFGSNILKNRIENVGVIGANLDLQRNIKAHNIRFGADMQFNFLKSSAHTEDIISEIFGKLDTRFPDGVNRMNNVAAYISHTWKINEKLTLNDGLRAGYSVLHSTLVDLPTQFNLPFTTIDQKTPLWSGNIGLIHSPSDDLKLSALISTGFRIPNVDDLSKIFAPAPGTVIVPNINLKPERTINYEIGIAKVYNVQTKWENSIYFTQFMDAIVTGNDRYNGNDSLVYDGFMCKVVSNQNKGRAYIYGFSSNLTSLLSEKFRFSFALNYAHGRLMTATGETPLNHINPLMARFQLSYMNKRFESDFFINYNGWKRMADYCVDPGGEDNQAYATTMGMPAWYTINLRGSYKLNNSITFQTGMENILDTQYRTFGSGINAPGRNIYITLKGNF